jgi:hypothetical protein
MSSLYEKVTNKRTPFHILFWVKKELPFFKKRVAGVTIWPGIIFLEQQYKNDEALLVHELTHIAQMRRNPLWPFFYLYQSLRYGYLKNKYEIEAYINQLMARRILRGE